MPSNRDLIAQAEKLALDLGVEISTDRLGNRALVELVDRLEAQREAMSSAVGDGVDVVRDALPSVDAPIEAGAPADSAASSAQLPAAHPPIDGAGDDTLGGPPPKVKPSIKPFFALSVARGRSITSNRGLLNEGAEVRLTDFLPADLESLIARGFVIRR